MTLDKLKAFFTQLFTDLTVEDSLIIIGFLFVSWLLGLLFGRWSKAGKIRRLKRELKAKDKDLIMLRAENGSYKEQLELKEEELQKAQVEMEEAKSRSRQLEEEYSHLRADAENNQQLASNISAENASNIEQVDELHKIIADLQYKNNELAKQITTGSFQSDGVGNLQDTVESTTNRMNALEAKLNRLEGENDRLQKTLSNIQVVQADLETAKPVHALTTDETTKEEKTAIARSAIHSAIGSKIKAASASEKNDLKKINGIGPFIEKKLNDIGIFTYEQISQLDAELITQITEAIQFFPGRINRDDWVGQAKRLMA
ncbi:MAG: hypothetical protein AB8F74_23695 [Saprospiraceae bacterium]